MLEEKKQELDNVNFVFSQNVMISLKIIRVRKRTQRS